MILKGFLKQYDSTGKIIVITGGTGLLDREMACVAYGLLAKSVYKR